MSIKCFTRETQGRGDTSKIETIFFLLACFLSDSELVEFESFVTNDLQNGELTFDGPYYTMSSEQTGTLQIVDGSYSASNIQNKIWEVGYQFQIHDRSFSAEQSIYDTVTDQGSFESTYLIFQALEDLVNNFYE